MARSHCTKLGFTATHCCTCAKPYRPKWKSLISTAGAIIEQIQGHFEIVAAESITLSPGRAEQFHAVYKGVVAHALFSAMVQELASGEACQIAS
jgi:hypothetical protein